MTKLLFVVFLGNFVAAVVFGATTCQDRYVWVADGSVECRYLVEASFWGLHKDPDYWCNQYPLTECCRTCTNLRNAGEISG
ncbi:hypothetical protein DPMN_011844 [Dreissena polymorpha]|uniref:Secreted protein n=1 Tax=Dreissena polymorpha TaxID=45954 RepID=A0A9D4S2U6_DREPO|nr:hypothetical protein DPMN_011844 [Dreissena polymorpha]